MLLVDRTEATVFAALLQSLREGSALPIRRPSYTEPTYSSRPIAATAAVPIPVDGAWHDVLVLPVPIQYFNVVTDYAIATQEALTDPGVTFRMLLNGSPLPSVSFPAGIDLCKVDGDPWPLHRRPTWITFAPPDVLSIQAMNAAAVPKTALAAFWGWSYDTINSERGSTGEGITDD